MSQENVEVARRWLEALSGETPDFETALALVHDEIVFVPPGAQAPYEGVESLRRWMEPDAFQEQEVTSFEPALVGDRTLLARLEITARGATSGIELDVITWAVFVFADDGLIRRIEVFLDHEQDAAREAARAAAPGA